MPLNFDLYGRINNLKIPDKHQAILFCCFEAISNAVHAIEERFGDKATESGKIDIVLSLEKDRRIKSIVISDNGIGLNDANFKSFETCDSQKKIQIGGKGVGRLLWLKVFTRTDVASVYVDPKGKNKSIKFLFELDRKDPIKNPSRGEHGQAEAGTQIVFRKPRTEFDVSFKPASFTRDVVLHFFSYFVSNSMPTANLTIETITKADKKKVRDIDLRTHIKENIIQSIEDTRQVEVDGQRHDFHLTHILASKKISNQLKNIILLSANRRVVEKIEIQNKFALNKLAERNAYVMVASSGLLDQRVDQERTGFKLGKNERDTILDALISFAESDLTEHIEKIRAEQKNFIRSILTEHPQLALIVKDIDKYADTLSPGMDEEAIGKTLFTLLYRDERKISKSVKEISELSDLTDEAQKQASELAQTINDHLKHSLAEYVAKRRQILTIARKLLQFKSDEQDTYHPEKAIHNLILPMGKIFASEDYEAHNLWIVDDLLSYYSYFASDKQIQAMAPSSSDKKEPDAIFFNPHGFYRPDTNDPIVVIEFKRPGDEKTSSDPVNQILDYAERLVDKTVKDPNGAVVSEIKKGKTFHCFIVCDLTETMRKLFKRSLAAHEMPDGEGFFGYSPNHLATITVISYRKMLKDAEKRNRAFFEKLGIYQPGNA